MRVVVTGGAGFIGAHSCRALLEAGHSVTAVDDLSHGKREAIPRGADMVIIDVRSPQLAAELVRLQQEAVLHLAAQMDVRRSVADPLYDASVNVLGTVNALAAARKTGARRFVFASSGGEEYAELARREGLSTISLRYANVYGPGQDPLGEAGVVAIFLHRMVHGGDPVINGDGRQTRDFVYVEDVARANLLALTSEATGALNVGTGVETSIEDLARLLAAAAGYPKAVGHGPAAPGEQRRSSVDSRAARDQLGWEPLVPLGEGLRRTAEWFRARARTQLATPAM